MSQTKTTLRYLLFAQHGWADTGQNIGKLLRSAVAADTKVIAPSLGYAQTFMSIELLVAKLSKIVLAEMTAHPDAALKIVGHSMGGLVWLELLHRYPQWWSKVDSLILLGSPVGGSNVARLIDPLGWGIGSAKDLGKNRRALAETIAQSIPTLSVASDLGGGTDGLVTLENTKFAHCHWQLVKDIPHSAMRYAPAMIPILQKFWANPQLGSPPGTSLVNEVLQILRNIPGMTDTDYQNFGRSQMLLDLPDSLTITTWRNAWRVDHVYLSQRQECLYAGYVGWLHRQELQNGLWQIKKLAA